MHENGYASDISTFLDEIDVPNEFKIKVCAGVNMPGGALKRPLRNHAQKRPVARGLAAWTTMPPHPRQRLTGALSFFRAISRTNSHAAQKRKAPPMRKCRCGATLVQPRGEEFWGYSSVGRASHTRHLSCGPYFVPYFVLFSTHNHSKNGKVFGKQKVHLTLDAIGRNLLREWWR